MATCKATMIFECNPLPGAKSPQPMGWTESVYYSGTPTDTSIRSKFELLCNLRAQFLVANASIIGQRYDQIYPNGPTLVLGKNYPGVLTAAPDFPKLCFDKTFADSTALYRRLWQFRGCTDSSFSNGRWTPPAATLIAFSNFTTALFSGDWLIQAIDKSQVLHDVVSIDASGNVVMANGETYTLDQKIQLLRCKNAYGQTVSGQFWISEFTSPYAFKLAGWTHGACTKGQIRRLQWNYPAYNQVIENNANDRMSTRKTGRPFFLSRGRNANRR